MDTFQAILAGIGTWFACYCILSILLGVLSNFVQFFRLLVYVEPWRTLVRMAVFLVSAWAGLEAFGAVA